ncbi:MAG TPA: hypothetical protein PKM52_03655, partial [bacterium]|nr:hypothetical protein [bacterium]
LRVGIKLKTTTMKEINKTIDNSIAQQIVLAVIVIFIFLAGLVTLLGHYYQSVEEVDHQIVQSMQPVASTVDADKLTVTYQSQYRGLIGDYLGRLDQGLGGEELLSATRQTKRSLLDLKVTAAFKDTHLSTVLLLDNLEAAFGQADNKVIQTDVSQLKQLLDNFSAN